MALFVHYVATLTAVGTSLKALLNLTDAQDVPFESLSLQAGPSNSNPVFVGGSGVTTTDYAIRIPTPTGGVPAVAERFEPAARPVKLSEVFVVGTAGEKLHVGGFPW